MFKPLREPRYSATLTPSLLFRPKSDLVRCTRRHLEAIKPVLDKDHEEDKLGKYGHTEFNLEIGDDRQRERSL